MRPARLRRAGWSDGDRTVAELGESAVLADLMALASSPAGLLIGPGDDAAWWDAPSGAILVTCDTLVEGVDFRRAWQSPYEVGMKAWGAAASDLAAMGAEAGTGLVAAVVPNDTCGSALAAIQLGLVEAAASDGATIAGGDLSSGAGPLAVTVTALGSVSGTNPVALGGAAAGDRLLVTGSLGAAAAGLELLSRGEEGVPPLWRQRLVAPRARLAEGAALRLAGVSAMTDISDGLLLDVGRLGSASRLRAEIWGDRVPIANGLHRRFGGDGLRLGVTGGEDYELLASVSEGALLELQEGWFSQLQPLTVVGRLTPGDGVLLLDEEGGTEVDLGGALGFRHF